MPVRTENLDQAIAEVIGTFGGAEEISVRLREDIVNYIVLLYSKTRSAM